MTKKTSPKAPPEEKEKTDPQGPKTALAIPYLKSEAAGEELRYALRSWERYFSEDFRAIVIGDREDWFSPEVQHVPHAPHLIKEDCACPAPSMVRDPQADVAHKLFTAIAAGILSGDFILTNDDIFLLGPARPADIAALKAFGTLDGSGKTTGPYSRNAARTARALAQNGLPAHRYGTHTPVLLSAQKTVQTIEKYEALENGLLLTSLYFNELYPTARPIQVSGKIDDPILASVYRPDVEHQLMEAIFAQRKFMNCDTNGWPSARPHLEKTFPGPSRFEK